MKSSSTALAASRRILWPTVTGSRAQRKRKVNILVRLGYNAPPKDLAEEIKRDFQVKVLLRPGLRYRHTRVLNRPTVFDLYDETRLWSGVIISGTAGSGKQAHAQAPSV